MAKKYRSIVCLKDWAMDGRLVFQKGKKYRVYKMDFCCHNNSNYISVQAKFDNGGTLTCTFWSGSEYFDIDGFVKEAEDTAKKECRKALGIV